MTAIVRNVVVLTVDRGGADEIIFVGWASAGKLGAIVARFFFMLPTFGSNPITSAREPGVT
ncbi:hypothetical protein [Halostagnicola sp. A-GB9-2]|uniref:hypothetical protein n=1 Tax=Halostagnicola sp. A-GB9-2 TaxID=3048066 RepID=UPI0024C0AD6D|nr:hypothetical protein [Halostagnicola sp. A-GB9-2]MDJ1430935.1 hypothetical protein [Halostagnicola sp. A-GB9-2]